MDKILSRIRKMLAIANDAAASEQERDTALQMVYKTLAHHNLSMTQVEQSGQQQTEARDNYDQGGWSMMWAKHVNYAIADLFFCNYYVGGKINGTKCRHHFIGRESNAQSAMLMAEWIVESILKEGRKLYGHNLDARTRAFGLGAAMKLRERVKELRKAEEATQQATTGTALVLANHYAAEKKENELVLRNKGITLRKGKSSNKSVNTDAYIAGNAFGGKINLNGQIAGASRTAKAIE